MAIGVVRRWAGGGGNVHPEVVAASRKAIAEWESLKARAKTVRSVQASAYGPPRIDLTGHSRSRSEPNRWETPDVKHTDTATMAPITSVRALRAFVQVLQRKPVAYRAKHIEHVRSSAKTLGASDLPWLANFLAANTTTKPAA